MELLKELFASRLAKRVHRVAGSLALLVAWAFFGTVHQVMRLDAFATMLFWIMLADFAGCLVFGSYHLSRPAPKPQNAPADQDEMEKAA